MKPWSILIFSFTVLCLFAAGNTLAAQEGSIGGERDKQRRMGAPLAEMMFYEKAEQAVEDGYGRIVPEPEDDGALKDTVTGSEQVEEGAVPSAPESLDRAE